MEEAIAPRPAVMMEGGAFGFLLLFVEAIYSESVGGEEVEMRLYPLDMELHAT